MKIMLAPRNTETSCMLTQNSITEKIPYIKHYYGTYSTLQNLHNENLYKGPAFLQNSSLK